MAGADVTVTVPALAWVLPAVAVAVLAWFGFLFGWVRPRLERALKAWAARRWGPDSHPE